MSFLQRVFIIFFIVVTSTSRIYADKNPRYEGDDTTCVAMFDEITSEFWDNDKLFPYSDDENIPDTIQLKLADAVRCFVMPVETKINSQFGWRWNRPHKGLDLQLQTGDPVKAAFDGVVRYAQYNSGGYGNLVIIRHYNGLETYYAHLSKINVEPNSVIKAGDILGEGGCTGSRCTGPHLHFETRYKDKPFNPQDIIAFDQGCLSAESVTLTKTNFVIGRPTNYDGTSYRFNAKKGNLKYSYKIKSGDTLLAIAMKNKTSVKSICRLNKLTPSSKLKIGKVIRLR
ncbi:MAG: peptidoglycan DD-metalloendopeptidase family protein [Bacteroidota bacterium]